MLEIILIRHGQTDWNQERRIMGRLPIPLNKTGKKESELLASALSEIKIDAIYTSPLMRTLQTARILARNQALKVNHAHELAEIDYGEWVGKTFDEVSREKNFITYHKTPKHAQAPGGEKMTAVYERAVSLVEKIRKAHVKGRVVLVSHADVIKAILIHYLGMDLNQLLTFRIDNSSLSLLWFNEKRARVMAVNNLCSPDKLFSSEKVTTSFAKSKKKK